ncbi:penicillin-binding protein 1A [Microcystis aeruginosa NIES-2520]|uniref:Penicillin-binding protein 1A n=1 Tax=Microcystis aeruginosa NIES-2520 TaxID=2303982 RepID=A0A5A5RUZ6_MICAE|nr:MULTISPECIES: penicillin-binding protein 1A [Microcystis]NCR78109.1 penicillin-binding protein 1A [Microcystis aeruginosa K13-06]MCA2665929.1 penicillin-binding protein 1A [Microcystis sp. M045S2]MCA2714006.1 penicillin-binding protein 1A [Microcystis sp. M172S2]MCA2804840.1 penicillin-binding protein 1A [Microcystis sp. M114S2]MCA2836131.1 penicillin-binding protein 1A [Microcystis sp. M007S1]
MSTSTLGNQDKEQKPSSDSDSFFQGVSRVAGGTALGLLMVSTAVVTGAVVGLAISYRNLPDVRILRGYVPTETSYIYDVKGRPLTSLHGEANREVVELDQISPNLKRAVMAIEDSHFYHHRGINPNSIGRAVVANWKSGGVVEGASTITMQLVKNIFLSHQRTVSRKLAEAVLAVRVEQVFSKNDILEMYLNNIYWGHNNYGVQTAAKSYFNKPAAQLNLAESAMMAGLIQAPEVYSPFNNYKTAKERQALVLSRMRTLAWITPAQEEAALKEPLKLGKPTAWQESKLPYVTDAVVAELRQKFGKETLIKGGMRIQTTIDLDFQNMAESTIQRAYNSLRRRGIRTKDLQISLVAVDPRTHFVKALVGGVDYNKSQLNRAIQSRRQPGSAFKPFVYYTAFASGRFTPETVVNDSPVRFREAGGFYSPKNYGGGYSGQVSLRSALMQSLNIPAVILGRRVGLNKVIEVCRLLGFESPLIAVTSLPLGSVDVTPLEMAGAYATFASNGWHSKPTFIMRVTDSRGNVMLDNTPKPKLVLDPWATASLNSVLQGVIQGGTATSAQIGRPAAGKTGTTDNEKNVWFVGYVPQLATAVWIGDDRNRTLGKGITGGGFAAPIWRDFMAQALKNERVEYFPSPSKFRKPTVK